MRGEASTCLRRAPLGLDDDIHFLDVARYVHVLRDILFADGDGRFDLIGGRYDGRFVANEHGSAGEWVQNMRRVSLGVPLES